MLGITNKGHTAAMRAQKQSVSVKANQASTSAVIRIKRMDRQFAGTIRPRNTVPTTLSINLPVMRLFAYEGGFICRMVLPESSQRDQVRDSTAGSKW